MNDKYLWLTLTLYYEARGESVKGQKAVAKVILNRAKAKGWEVRNVVNARKQFSCYNKGLKDPLLHIKDIPTFLKLWDVAQEAVAEWEAGDTLQGATHYFNQAAVTTDSGRLTGKPPVWAAAMVPCGTIEHHQFFRED